MLRGIRVAVADAHTFLRKSLRLLLEGHSSTVVWEAINGVEAIELVDKHRPDVIIIDPLLPILSGLEATRIIASSYPQTKVIVYSPSSDDGIRSRALEAGAWHFVKKDCYIRGLINIVRSSHDSSASRQQGSPCP